MTSKKFLELEQKLIAHGCKPFAEQTEIIDRDDVTHRYFDSGERTIRLTESFYGGLSCWVSNKPQDRLLDEKNWMSIYSITVPNFDNFDDDQSMDWIISVPRGDEYVDHLFSHIEALWKLQWR